MNTIVFVDPRQPPDAQASKLQELSEILLPLSAVLLPEKLTPTVSLKRVKSPVAKRLMLYGLYFALSFNSRQKARNTILLISNTVASFSDIFCSNSESNN